MEYTDYKILQTLKGLQAQTGKLGYPKSIPQPTFSKIMNGKTTVSVKNLLHLCGYFDITPTQFFNRFNKLKPRVTI